MSELRRFFIALAYFTRLPVPAWVGWAPDELNRAARYFPAVGLVVGGVSALTLWLALLVLPGGLAVVLSMALSLRLTGAFHEDGLADAADGLGGGWERADVLRIMKDSRIGTYGAATLCLALLAKWSALDALGMGALTALVVAHPLSRLAALVLMWRLPYVREDESSRAKPVAQGIGRVEVAIGALGGLLPLVLLTGLQRVAPLQAALCLLLTTGASLWWARLLRRRLGGYTGDCLGALQQGTELAIYCALLVRTMF